MILYSPDNSALMEIQSLERSGDELVIKGKVFGTMPITARLKPEQARRLEAPEAAARAVLAIDAVQALG